MIPSRRGPMCMMSSCKPSLVFVLMSINVDNVIAVVNYYRCDENFNTVFVLKRSLRLCICDYSTATTCS